MDAKQPTAGPLLGFALDDIWPILRKQRGVIGLFLGTVLVSTLVGSLLQTPQYRATAVIQLSPRAGQEVAVQEVVDARTSGFYEINQFQRTQIQIILSRSVREEVVRRYNALGFDDMLLEDGGASTLAESMSVVPSEQSQLVSLSVSHPDPERAAILANLVFQVYEDTNLDARRRASAGATSWLQGQLVEYEQKVRDASQELHDFKASTQLVDVEERMTTLHARFDALNSAYGTLSTELVLAETNLASHRSLLERDLWEELAKHLDSPLLDQAYRDYAVALTEDADLASRYGPKHPSRLQLQARFEAILGTLEVEVGRIIASEQAHAEVVREGVASLEAEIQGVKTEMLAYQRKGSDYDALKGQLERYQATYDKLSKRLAEVSLSAQTQLNNVQLVDEALPPLAPYKPNIPLSLVIASLVGLAGGVGLALVNEYRDDTISSQIDVTAYLKVPFLGLVPRLPEGLTAQQADTFTYDHPGSSAAEAVRGVRTLLEMNGSGVAPRRILVTSAIAREGKTSTTLRLAISFAQMDRKVVIIDADLRRPRLHKIFRRDNDVGLSSYLLGAAEIDDLPVRTPLKNLWTISSGPASEHPAELLTSPRIDDLLAGLDERFDVVLIDTPPSVALADAVTLSRRVDGVVLVVKEQAVSRETVRQTVGMLRQVDAHIFGVVLNHVDLQRSGSKYKYYYAYRDYYATYGHDPSPDPDAEKAAK